MSNVYNCGTCKNSKCIFYNQRYIKQVTQRKHHMYGVVIELTPAEFTNDNGCTNHSDTKSR